MLAIWTQNYDPLSSALWSPLAAALPVVVLLGLLASGRVSAPWAAMAGLLTAILVAAFVFRPIESNVPNGPGLTAWCQTVLAAASFGAIYGLLPIGWIVLNAVFLYVLTVETGTFEVVKQSVVSISRDRRVQAVLIAFCFGAFLEGAAGFGTPVAVSAALMMGAGFRPVDAAVLSLLANTAPVAFGALGTPITTLSRVTGLDELKLSAAAGRQLPVFSLIVPAWLVWSMAGWSGVWGVWPVLLVAGGSFAALQFAISNYHGPWLVDVVAGIISLICLTVLLRFWQPKKIWRYDQEEYSDAEAPKPALRKVVSAWMPWMMLTCFVFVWGLPSVKALLNNGTLRWNIPALHQEISRTAPIVLESKAEDARFELVWLSATGTGIFLAAVTSGIWLQVSPRRFARLWWETLLRMRWPIVTIMAMLAIAFTTRFSGMDATLGLAFTRTGTAYPMFAALLGWLGVALTGSDTASNAMFGGLQTVTAARLVNDGVLPLTVSQASILLAAANSTGGVMGKMIDAQSIVVAAVATNQHGQESIILRRVFWHSLTLAILVGTLIMWQAYIWPNSIPE